MFPERRLEAVAFQAVAFQAVTLQAVTLQAVSFEAVTPVQAVAAIKAVTASGLHESFPS